MNYPDVYLKGCYYYCNPETVQIANTILSRSLLRSTTLSTLCVARENARFKVPLPSLCAAWRGCRAIASAGEDCIGKLSRHPAIIAVLVMVITGLLAGCSSKSYDENQSLVSANNGLNAFKSLQSTESTLKVLGPELTQSEVDQSRLGDRIKVYFISLDSIKAYHPNEDASVLYDAHQYVYPVLNKNKTRVIISETVELNTSTGKWDLAGFGDQATIGLYQAFGKAYHFTGATYLVRIPGLSLNFLGGQLKNKPSLIYLGERNFDSIYPGKPMLLDDVLRQLKPRALQTQDFFK